MFMNNISIKEFLQSRKLKTTKTRINLLTEMKKKGSAMSYSSIESALNPINRITLYRTIETFKKKVLFIKHTKKKKKHIMRYVMKIVMNINTKKNIFTLNV